MLGICYGQQTMVSQLGGEVIPSKIREFGRAILTIQNYCEFRITRIANYNKFFVQEIKNFDRPLLREIKKIWNHIGIRPREWRCNFFRVLPGGELPLHVDVLSKCSVVIPMTEMTGNLYFDDGTEVLYQNMTVINTKVAHGVKAPTKERIVFHMGIHDTPFEEIKIGHNS